MDNKDKAKKLKSAAKAMGVKSTFVAQDRLIMTSFGKGNEAVLEKHIENAEVENLNDPSAFDAAYQEKTIQIQGKRKVEGAESTRTEILNPLWNEQEVRKDLIGMKPVLEKRYFGREFPYDNIHIQLIYNILDIEKIMAVFISNITYTIKNLERNDDAVDRYDPLGYDVSGLALRYFKSPEEAKEQLEKELEKEKKEKKYSEEKYKREFTRQFSPYVIIDNLRKNRRIGYFGYAFITSGKEEEVRSWKDVFYIISLLSQARQNIVHDPEKEESSGRCGRSFLYNISKEANADALGTLDTLYKEKIESLKSFPETAMRNNLPIVCEALKKRSIEDKCSVAKDFYYFSALKTYKNCGFSIKLLRETLIKAQIPELLTDIKWDSVRSKLYAIFDFLIWDYFIRHEELTNKLIANLRASTSDKQKQDIYSDMALEIWADSTFRDSMLFAQARIEELGNGRKNTVTPFSQEEKKQITDAINAVALKPSASYFTKFIYLLTLFLDGKEINELLTTLINKFDNIASLMKVMEKEDLSSTFVAEYDFFNSSRYFNAKGECVVLEELRNLNSFARMTKAHPSAKKAMMEDALLLLGKTRDDIDFTEVLDQCMPVKDDAYNKPDTGLRNFIINNMIESRRFLYIVRYTNPIKARKLITSEPLVKLVLADFDDKLIDRYYKSCTLKSDFEVRQNSREVKENELVRQIMQVDFSQFGNVDQKANPRYNQSKQRLITLMSLYLNILYQVTKNLVYINSRYVIGFHCVERDSVLYKDLKQLKEIDWKTVKHKNNNYCQLSKAILDEKEKKTGEKEYREDSPSQNKKLRHEKRILAYCRQDLKNADGILISQFRNDVSHMNIISNIDLFLDELTEIRTYFALYHFAAQRYIMYVFLQMEKDGKIKATEKGKGFVTIKNGKEKVLDFNPKSLEFMDAAEKYHSYSKDFVKALCVPFMYNLPRFKNLSIEGLFDRNRPGQGE